MQGDTGRKTKLTFSLVAILYTAAAVVVNVLPQTPVMHSSVPKQRTVAEMACVIVGFRASSNSVGY
jgi:hypothetical protein